MKKIFLKPKIFKGINILISFLLLSYSFHSFDLNAQKRMLFITIKECYDGDTCTTKNGEKIRLACIDAPEIAGKNAEPMKAERSKEFLNNLVLNKKVFIKRINTDRYGRTVAEIFINDINIQKLLVNNGYTKVFNKYAYQCDWAF